MPSDAQPVDWAQLPEALIAVVSSSLSSDDEQNCRLVCKSWSDVVAKTINRLQPCKWDFKTLSTTFTGISTLSLVKCSPPSVSDIQALGNQVQLSTLIMPKGGLCGRRALNETAIKCLGNIKSLTTLDLSGNWLEADLSGLGGLRNLKSLVLGACRWGGASGQCRLNIPGNLTQLTQLDLSSPLLHVSDKDLDVLGGMQGLCDLNLAECRGVSDNGGVIIGELASLVRLNLTRTSVSSRIIPCIAKLNNLEHLNLEGTEVTDEGVSMLGECSSLKYLNLAGCGMVTEQCIRGLGRASNLQEICLEGILHMSTRGLSQLSRLKDLRAVKFDMPQWMGDEEVGLLTNLMSLERVSVIGCRGTCLVWFLSHPSLREITLTNGRLGNDHIQYLSTLTSLETLNISKCEHASMMAFDKVRCLKRLKELSLEILHGSLERHFVAGSISPLTNLVTLKLSSPLILDETVAELWRLFKLANLHLEDCAYLTDIGLEFLAMMHSLEKLNLKSPCQLCATEDAPAYMGITESGLVKLCGMRKLRCLTIMGRHAISAKDWGAVNGSSSLRKLVITVPHTQHYIDGVITTVKSGIIVKFHTACPGLVDEGVNM